MILEVGKILSAQNGRYVCSCDFLRMLSPQLLRKPDKQFKVHHISLIQSFCGYFQENLIIIAT